MLRAMTSRDILMQLLIISKLGKQIQIVIDELKTYEPLLHGLSIKQFNKDCESDIENLTNVVNRVMKK